MGSMESWLYRREDGAVSGTSRTTVIQPCAAAWNRSI